MASRTGHRWTRMIPQDLRKILIVLRCSMSISRSVPLDRPRWTCWYYRSTLLCCLLSSTRLIVIRSLKGGRFRDMPKDSQPLTYALVRKHSRRKLSHGGFHRILSQSKGALVNFPADTCDPCEP